MDEEELITAVLRVKTTRGDASMTAAQVFEVMQKDGVDCTLSQVKKAASKAAKRAPTALPAAASKEETKEEEKSSKKEEKKQRALADAMKSAENAMKAAQTRMRDRWMADGVGKAPPSEGAKLVQYSVTRAMTGVLENREVLSKERLEADVATLEWMILPAMPLDLPPEAQWEAGRRLTTLKAALTARNPLEAAKDLYVSADEEAARKVLGENIALGDNASLDRMMRLAHNAEALRLQKAAAATGDGAAGVGADPMEEMD